MINAWNILGKEDSICWFKNLGLLHIFLTWAPLSNNVNRSVSWGRKLCWCYNAQKFICNGRLKWSSWVRWCLGTTSQPCNAFQDWCLMDGIGFQFMYWLFIKFINMWNCVLDHIQDIPLLMPLWWDFHWIMAIYCNNGVLSVLFRPFCKCWFSCGFNARRISACLTCW